MKLNLDKNKKYILGCSSGPDSMALFHMLYTQGYDFVVVNVDYNYRENSKEETDLVEAYCKEKSVRFYTKTVQFSTIFGNFEAWARKIRYEFFMEIGQKIGVFNIVVAHQQDDLIETFLMQKERGGLVSIYGLSRSYKRNNFFVNRPLLDYSKKDLIQYCNENKIPFIIDPTNADTNYKRNYFRANVIRNLTPEKRQEILSEIASYNEKLESSFNKVHDMIVNDLLISKDDFSTLSPMEGEIALSLILNEWNLFFPISLGLVKDMQFAIQKGAKTYKAKLTNDLYFTFDHDYIGLVNKTINYEISIDENFKNNEIFKINLDSERAKNLVNLKNLVIKPAIIATSYKIGDAAKKINRIFIDFKLPQAYRPLWPGIFDENNNLLYMPRYRKDYCLNKESVLVFDIFNLIKYVEK